MTASVEASVLDGDASGAGIRDDHAGSSGTGFWLRSRDATQTYHGRIEPRDLPGPVVAGRSRAVLMTVAVLAWIGVPGPAEVRADTECSHSGLHDYKLAAWSQLVFKVVYEQGDPGSCDPCADGCSNSSYFCTGETAQACADAAANAFAAFDTNGFDLPFQTNIDSNDEFELVAGREAQKCYSSNSCDCVKLGRFVSFDDEFSLGGTVGHEVFHAVQRRYAREVGTGCDGISSHFGGWVAEGQAAFMEDTISEDLDAYDGRFRSRVRSYLSHPYKSVMEGGDYKYDACLFWKYCTEQFGISGTEPARGVDFIRTFWERAVAADNTNSLDHLEYAIQLGGGASLDDAFHDFSICNYTKQLDVSEIPNASRYSYIDEDQYGEGQYGTVATFEMITPGDFFVQTEQPAYSACYYEKAFQTNSAVIGVVGSSISSVGWSLIQHETASSPVEVSRQQGREYARAFLAPDCVDDSNVLAIVSTLGVDTGHALTSLFATGQATVTIVDPTPDHFAYPGPAIDPGRILVRLMVEGPDGLTPDSPDNLSMLGLEGDQFSVTIGDLPASVYSAAYVGGEYWLVVQAPPQAVDGTYRLTVELCDSVAISYTSVSYKEIKVNHVIVLDGSSSMNSPSTGTSKFDAAKMAAAMFIDSVPETDNISAYMFSGDGGEGSGGGGTCNADVVSIAPLGPADAAKRFLMKALMGPLVASGMTSIGDGLWAAQDEVDLGPSADIDSIVLLSDGNETEGRYWYTSNPSCSATEGPVKDRFSAATHTTLVETFSFGSDANQSLMQEIATLTGGIHDYIPVENSFRGVSNLSMSNRLAAAYVDALAHSRQLERFLALSGEAAAPVTSVPISFGESGLSSVTIVINVDEPTANLVVELEDPSGHLITDPADATIYSTETHACIHLRGMPMLGTWTARLNVATNTQYLINVLGVNRHGTRLDFAFSQVRNGGLDGIPDEIGYYEQGVPVRFVAMLSDAIGPILNATLLAEIELPDGTLACGDYRLRDEGKDVDGEPGNGTYGLLFTPTSQGSRKGVNNDDQPGSPGPYDGLPGTYSVTIRATGIDNLGQPFERIISTGFHITASVEDADTDGMPDTWEIYYGTNPTLANGLSDADGDGRTARQEFFAGTHPFDADTDADGEMDGSETAAGRCPLNPADGALPYPLDVEILTNDADEWHADIPGRSLLLRFMWDPTYHKLHIQRAVDDPALMAPYVTLTAVQLRAGHYLDENLNPAQTYYYRVQAETASGALSRMSPVVSGTPLRSPLSSQWTCGTGLWDSPACWSVLDDADTSPGHSNITYDAILPAGLYTVTLNPLDIELNSLTMPDTATTLIVGGGASLTVIDSILAKGTLRSSGGLTAAPTADLDVSACNLIAETGGSIALPLEAYIGSSGANSEVFRAQGVGSLLSLPLLRVVDGSTQGAVTIEAVSGGRIDLPTLDSLLNDVNLSSINAASVLNCPALNRVPPGSNILVQNGAALVGAPFIDLRGATVTIRGAGSVCDTSAVTMLDDAEVFADGAAIVSFPLVTTYRTGVVSNVARSLRSKNNSRLSFPSLSTITAGAGTNVLLWTYRSPGGVGGRLSLPALSETRGEVRIWIDGDGALIELGNLDLEGLSVINVGDAGTEHVPGGELRVLGSVRHAMTDPTTFKWRGDATRRATLNMVGGTDAACVTLEVAGRDAGSVPSGWTNNFQIDRLLIGPGAHVQLVDEVDNGHRGGSAGNAEALYVETVEFADAAGRLHLNGRRLYFHSLVGNATQISPGGCCEPCDTNCDGSINAFDIQTFVDALGPTPPTACSGCAADANRDGSVNGFDIQDFLECLGG